MNRATYPPIRVITAAQQTSNARITSRRSSGSSLAAKAVEPTRSQNRTVSWRLSGSVCGEAEAVGGAAAAGVAPDSAAIALRIRFRWPRATPNLSRSVSVTSGKTSRSMAFSAKTVAYCPSPISSSQAAIRSSTLTIACPQCLAELPVAPCSDACQERCGHGKRPGLAYASFPPSCGLAQPYVRQPQTRLNAGSIPRDGLGRCDVHHEMADCDSLRCGKGGIPFRLG